MVVIACYIRVMFKHPEAKVIPTGRVHSDQWYALHTRSRHEKAVGQYLRQVKLQTYVPLIKKKSRCASEKTLLDIPAIPGYIFVHCLLTAEVRALIKRTSGVLQVVENAGRPAIIPEGQIKSLQIALENSLQADVHEYLAVGDAVRVIRGPIAGAEGILVRVHENRDRLVLRIDYVNQALSIEVDASCVEPLNAVPGLR
jgi:transcription antitermination factor NusG